MIELNPFLITIKSVKAWTSQARCSLTKLQAVTGNAVVVFIAAATAVAAAGVNVLVVDVHGDSPAVRNARMRLVMAHREIGHPTLPYIP